MMSQPKVSVLVPVYNAEKYLAECLDSILTQDFTDYELLISDDCSTDGTAAIIESFAAKDSRIRWWRNSANLKQAANLNLCLREARGEFIKFVFADDKLLTTTALQQMVQVLEADPSVVLVSSASHVITADSKLLQVRDHFQETGSWSGTEILLRCLENPATWNPTNLIGEPTVTMFRRQPAARGFDERFRSLLDLELWSHLLERGKFGYIAEPLSAFRRHGAQETLVNRASGASARDGFRLQQIYFPKLLQRRLIPRSKLFEQVHRLRKINSDEARSLSDTLKQSLGKGWLGFYAFRYRLWRVLQDLQFWRQRRSFAGGVLPAQWDPAPPVAGRSDHPLVSVLIPVYNGGKYLAECLDSILMQDFPDLEILIADDGSTDGSRELIQHYAAKDPRIRWWRNPKNLGLAANFNACLREARGKYIRFVLQDDKLLSPLSLLKMASILENHPTIALVSSISHIITANSRLIQVRDYFQETRWWSGEEILLRCLEDSGTANPVNLIGEPTVVMFRREQATRGFDEQFRQLIDLDFWFHLLEQGKFGYIAEPLSAFRRHGAQETLVNRASGASARDGFRLQQIYFPKLLQRRLIPRSKLFEQVHRLRKINSDEARSLSDTLKQSLGKGWLGFYAFRYRLWRVLQDLQFWRQRRSFAGGVLPAQWDPAPPVAGRSDHPLVSVLIPVYNGGKYLAECLDSILMQDFPDLEILIADDGSTDGSRELIQHYAAKDPRIRWWRNPKNLGLAANFNACLREARHDYIKYVLQDDLLLSRSAIRQMVQALDTDPAVSLVGSASYLINSRSQQVELRNAFRQSGVMDGKRAILHCLARNGNLIGEPSLVMFRREQAGRGYDERYRQLIDLDFWFHLLEQGRFAYIAEPLCAFRQHAEQQTAVNRKSGAHVQDELMLAQHWLSRPWLRETAGRQVLFKQIYNLRKHHGERARPYIADIMASLTTKWYGLYWLQHKLTSPFRNLTRWLRKRTRQQAAQGRIPPMTAAASDIK